DGGDFVLTSTFITGLGIRVGEKHNLDQGCGQSTFSVTLGFPMPIISASALTDFAERILLAAGVPAHKAAIAATSLVASKLRGVDSHGIQLLSYYLDQLLAGELDPHSDGRIISESGACLVYDGQNGLGQWIAEVCCDHAIRIANE